MNRMITVVILAVAAISAMASTDPFVGNWKLDGSRSTYPRGTCPKTMMIEMRSTERGISYRSNSIYWNGGEIHAQYTAEYDGKQVVVLGTHGMLLPVTLKRIDSHTVVASYMRGFELVASSRRVVSADGRTMTITTKFHQKRSNTIKTVGVYSKEKDKD